MKKANQQIQPSQRNIGQSFTIQNNITQLPQKEKKKVSTKQGFKIINAGQSNDLPQMIARIVKESSTLSSVIDSKANYVSYGEIQASESFLKKIKEDLNKRYDYYELEKRVSTDYFTYGYAFIEVVVIGKETFIYHLDASKVRYMDYLGETAESVAISDDWTDTKKEPVEVALYPNFSSGEMGKTQVILISDYDTNSQEYPLPKWSGAFYDAQVESLIGQYNANQFENGVTLSSILKFDFGDVTNEDDLRKKKTKLETEIKGTSGGRSGKTLVVPITGDVETPEYIQYPMQKEGSFKELQSTTENNIVKASSWFRSLAGLESAGSLGNNQQLRNEWVLAERLISNVQYKIMSHVKMAFGDTYINEDVIFSNESPVDIATTLDVNLILTQDEKRMALGFEPLTGVKDVVALNGAQVTSMVEVVKAFALGELTENQASNILKSALGITIDEAKQILAQ
jgi:hypothetical protein